MGLSLNGENHGAEGALTERNSRAADIGVEKGEGEG
jgi:hypothetical protein